MIGVTASNGKTTTSFMTNAVLEEHGLKTGLIGTVIVKAGSKIRPAVLTTPESLDLHHYLYQMVEQEEMCIRDRTTSAVLAVSAKISARKSLNLVMKRPKLK